jgi:hypothetical protein
MKTTLDVRMAIAAVVWPNRTHVGYRLNDAARVRDVLEGWPSDTTEDEKRRIREAASVLETIPLPVVHSPLTPERDGT